MTSDVAVLPLVPYPARVQAAPDVRLTESSRITSTGMTLREAQILAGAIERHTGLILAVSDDHAAESGDIDITLSPDDLVEGYSLTTESGAVVLSASDPVGAFWATQTLLQLLARDEAGWLVRGARISDAPRFAYRGVMLDVARHFFRVEDVKRYIDAAASLKFNHLHLHLTDDQGWRLEFESYPNLTALGSATASMGDEGGFYTAADFAEIVSYAESRHMTVVPELDMPSHTHAVTLAYPEFTEDSMLVPSVVETAELFDQALPVHGEAYTGWSVGFSALKSGDEATNEFVHNLFHELAQMTPGPYLHLGGDEALGTTPEAFAEFIAMASRAVQATGKQAIAWHEVGKVQDLAQGTIGQYWGYVEPQPGYGDEARAIVERGGSLILSPADVAYLDMKFDAASPLGLTWADGPTSLQSAYSWEPTDVVAGLDASAILGIEAPLWTETARTMDDVLTLAFPRASAIAEIAWSQQSGPERTWDSFRDRLAQFPARWQAESIPFYPFPEVSWITR